MRNYFKPRRASHAEQSGFTLVELLLAVIISAVIVGPITGAIIIGLRTTGSSTLRLSQTRDIELIQGILPRDALSATSIQTNVAASGTCAGTPAPLVHTNLPVLLVMKWSTPTVAGVGGVGPPTTSTTNYEVDYVYAVNSLVPPTGTVTRYFYKSGSPCVPVIPSSSLVATSLSTAASPTVLIAGNTVKLTFKDSSGATYAACAQMRSPATTTTAAGPTTTSPTCTG